MKIEKLQEIVRYDPDTGLFYWLVNRGGTARVGSRAGHISRNGYVQIRVDGHFHCAHRLAWFLTYGVIPDCQIDHVNGNPTDNRICNLRVATHAENQRNRGKNSNNTSGFKGVRYFAGKFRAGICHQSKSIHLGYYLTAEEAHAAYCKAAQELHGDFARVA